MARRARRAAARDPVMYHLVTSVDTPAGLATLKLATLADHSHAMELMLQVQQRARGVGGHSPPPWHSSVVAEVATTAALNDLHDSGGFPLFDMTPALLNELSRRLALLLGSLTMGTLAREAVVSRDLVGAGPAVLAHPPVARWSDEDMEALGSMGAGRRGRR